jgi:hypothetical protein
MPTGLLLRSVKHPATAADRLLHYLQFTTEPLMIFDLKQQIEEQGYIIISDMSDDELAELFQVMINDEEES